MAVPIVTSWLTGQLRSIRSQWKHYICQCYLNVTSALTKLGNCPIETTQPPPPCLNFAIVYQRLKIEMSSWSICKNTKCSNHSSKYLLLNGI